MLHIKEKKYEHNIYISCIPYKKCASSKAKKNYEELKQERETKMKTLLWRKKTSDLACLRGFLFMYKIKVKLTYLKIIDQMIESWPNNKPSIEYI